MIRVVPSAVSGKRLQKKKSMTIIDSIRWECSEATVEQINKANAPVLVIAGVSGSGKSYLADHLIRRYANLAIVKTHTTRPPRESDNSTYFSCVSNRKFNELLEQDAFFLARYERHPCYGYLKDDVLDVIKNKKVPLFMFRHSGIKMITSLIVNVYIIAIECAPSKSIEYSKSEIDTHSVNFASKSQFDILALTERCNNGCILVNRYDNKFVNNEELHAFVRRL